MGHLHHQNVTIIGAGIAGLTAACAFAARGAKVSVFERAEALSEVGAGLQISPNAGRVLAALGLADDIDRVAVRSHGVQLFDHRGSLVTRLDLASHRPDAPFWLIHRARLVAVLENAARKSGVQIHLGHPVDDLPDAPLILGADGLHSGIRRRLNDTQAPFFTGQTAWRAIIPDPDPIPYAQVFMGPGRHLVSYPLAGGLRNIVAVMERENWRAEGWTHLDDPANLRAAFDEFGGPVPGWLAQIEQVGIWGLFRHQVADRWHDGRCVILGDAAHPSLPFMAQGAVMAIEDAWILAACLDRNPDRIAALDQYQALRRPRCQKVVEAANKNARNYHLHGVKRRIAHAGLRAIGRVAPKTLLGAYDWLYDYDPIRV